MPVTDITETKPVEQKPKPSWMNSSPEEKECFTQTLLAKLENVSVPESINCRNPTCDIPAHRVDSDGYIEEVLNSLSESEGQSISWTSGRHSGVLKTCHGCYLSVFY